MNTVEYPWRWLGEAVGASFALRYPWADTLQRAASSAEAVCFLLPSVAGSLFDWATWLAGILDRENSPPCPISGPDFESVTRTLADTFQIEDAITVGHPADWSSRFLAECRRQMPHVDAIPLLVVDADEGCVLSMQDLVDAQRRLGYSLLRPVLLRRAVPRQWTHEIVRFGLPELVGDLHRIDPAPERDLPFWTNLIVALTVAWEAGATPRLADELWEQLRLARKLSLRDNGFDDWLRNQLDEFAKQNANRDERLIPNALAFGPVATVEDRLWQSGVVAWQNGCFEITPLHARIWVSELGAEDARESLRRRRLTNVPLARWLSAWATSIEEALRVRVLQFGNLQFRRFLERQRPRNWRASELKSRWEELNITDGELAVDIANFVDLATFIAAVHAKDNRGVNVATLLDECRISRNRILHARKLSAQDIIQISRAVNWLSEAGAI